MIKRLVVILTLIFSVWFLLSGSQSDLRILKAYPRGQLEKTDNLEITILFSDDMKALGEDKDVRGYIRIKPEVEGEFKWRGNSTLVFKPKDRFRYSTEYRVKIKKGLSSVNGKVLKKDYEFKFRTPLPLPVEVKLLKKLKNYPYLIFKKKGEENGIILYEVKTPVLPSKSLVLCFNQKIDLNENLKKLRFIHEKNEKEIKIPFSFIRSKEYNGKCIKIDISQFLLDFNQNYILKIEKGFKGGEGSIRNDKEIQIKLKTIDELKPCAKTLYIEKDFYINDYIPVDVFFNGVIRRKDLKNYIEVLKLKNGKKIKLKYGALPIYRNGFRFFINKKDLASEYLMKIKKGFPGLFGLKSEKDYTIKIKRINYKPFLNFFSYRNGVLNFEVKGIYKLKADVYKIDNPSDFILSGYDLSLLKRKRVKYSFKKGEKTRFKIHARKLFNGKGDVFYVKVNEISFDKKHYYKVKDKRDYYWYGLVSDYDIDSYALFLRDNVYFTAFKNEERVKGLNFNFLDSKHLLIGGKTNDKGFFNVIANITISYDSVYFLVMKYGYKYYVHHIYKYDDDCCDFDDGYRYYITTDRKYYKKGDEVFIAGVIKRYRNGKLEVPKDKMNLLINYPGDFSKEINLKLDEFGGFIEKIKLNDNVKNGYYGIHIKEAKKDGWESSNSADFKVTFFKPLKQDLKIQISGRDVVGDEIKRIKLKGKYLNDAPMSGGKIYVKGELYDAYDNNIYDKLKGKYGGYSFCSCLTREKHIKIEKVLNFNNNGVAFFDLLIPNKKFKVLGKIRLSFIAEAKNKEEIKKSLELAYYPSNSIVGIRVDEDIYINEPVKFRFVSLDINGNEKKTIADIIIRKYPGNNKKPVIYKRINDFLIDKYAEIEEKFEEEGEYSIVVISRDEKGRKFISSSIDYFIVSNREDMNDSMENKSYSYGLINMEYDDKVYSLGDNIKIKISSVFNGKADIILFREGIIKHKMIRLEKNKPYILNFKITKEYFPAFDLVVFGKFKDSKGKYQFGYKTRKISTYSGKELMVELNIRRELKPSKDYEIKLKVKNKKGKGERANVILYAVDKGTLMLGKTDFDIFDSIYKGISYIINHKFYYISGMKSLILRNIVSQKISIKKAYENKKCFSIPTAYRKIIVGASISNNDFIRKNFKTTLFFKKVETDEKGEAVLKFKTSDLLTTYRLMAVAYNDDSFGSAEKNFTVTKKLLMKESFPDFLRLGDKTKAGVILTNRTGKVLTVKVGIKTEGKIKITGEKEKLIKIEPLNTETVFFDTEAVEAGEERVRFYALSGKLRDGLEKKVEIKENIVRETYTDFASGKEIKKKYFLDKEKNSELLLRITPSLSNFLFEISRKLIIYPYECLEQRTSKIMPYLFIGDELIKYGVVKYDTKQVKEKIIEYLSRIKGFVNEDGGVGYYEGMKSSPYLSSYVLYTLKLIKDKGFEVDDEVVKGLLGYVKKERRNNPFSLYVSALWGEDVKEEIKKRYRNLESLTSLSKAFLLKAVAISNIKEKEKRKMEDRIIREFEKGVFVEADFAYFKKPSVYDRLEYPFYTNRYLTAVVLDAILETRGDYELADRMMRYLLEGGDGRDWDYMTQENVWIIKALNEYLKRVERGSKKEVEIKLKEGEREIFKKVLGFVKPEDKFSKRIKSEARERRIEFSSKSEGRFYVFSELRVNADISRNVDNGFRVERRIYNERGEDVEELRRGEVYQVVIRVKTREPMDYVVIDEPVVGGIQVLRKEFLTTRELFDFRKERKEKSYYWWWGVKKKEYHKDRIVFYTYRIKDEFEVSYHIKALYSGKYTFLPTSAFAMYHPQYNGRESVRVINIIGGNK